MPHLRSLDKFIILDFERTKIASLYPAKNMKRSKLNELYRFRPFNKATTSWRSKKFQLLDHLAVNDNSDDEEAPASFFETTDYRISSLSNSINQHLNRETYDLRRRFEYCSPILTIQKTVKMFLARKKYLRKRRATKIVAWAVKRWELRSRLEQFMKRLGLTRAWLFNIGRVRKI